MSACVADIEHNLRAMLKIEPSAEQYMPNSQAGESNDEKPGSTLKGARKDQKQKPLVQCQMSNVTQKAMHAEADVAKLRGMLAISMVTEVSRSNQQSSARKEERSECSKLQIKPMLMAKSHPAKITSTSAGTEVSRSNQPASACKETSEYSKLQIKPMIMTKGHQAKITSTSAGVVDDKKAQKTQNKTESGKQTAAIKASQAKAICDTDPHLLREMEKNMFFPLKAKSTKFQNAKFFCRLCEYHCRLERECWDHIKDRRHKRRLEIATGDKELKQIEPPSPTHVHALNNAVEAVVAQEGLTQDNIALRVQAVRKLEQYLLEQHPALDNIRLVLYGSSCSGFGLNSSDVNVLLIPTQNAKGPPTLTTVYKFLQGEDYYENIERDFKAKLPFIRLLEPENKLVIKIVISDELAVETSDILCIYNTIDDRMHKLAITFRHWAKVCQVDKQEKGTLPAYSFSLLTIFFLQQVEPPVLPVLHEMVPSEPESSTDSNSARDNSTNYLKDLSELYAQWRCNNHQSIGELWIAMLRFYSFEFKITNVVVSIRQKKPVSLAEKKWAGRKLHIEDPFICKRNIASTISSLETLDYIHDCFRQSYRYFSLANSTSKAKTNSEQKEKKRRNESDSIKIVSTENGGKQNTCQKCTVLSNDAVLEISVNTVCIDKALVCQNTCLQDYATLLSSDILNQAISTVKTVATSAAMPHTSVAMDNTGQLVKSSSQSNKHRCHGSVANQLEKSVLANSGDAVLPAKHDTAETDADLTVNISQSCDLCSQDHTDPCGFSFNFSLETLSDGKGPKIICASCKEEGHLKNHCPQDILPPIHPLPVIDPEFLYNLNRTLDILLGDFRQLDKHIQRRDWIVEELQDFICSEIYPNAGLEVFGSSVNGFGFHNSDIDICMRFKGHPTAETMAVIRGFLDYGCDPEKDTCNWIGSDFGFINISKLCDKNGKGIDCVEVIEELNKYLRRHPSLMNVFSISTAKVPIVKFKHRQTGIEGDISLYNTLAQHNSDMLKMYVMIDPRVQILGYAVKLFAKICDIGDASRGSLSSYAYILMLLHYLQQCKPPVIPVLQELHTGPKPEILVDGWNAWYFKDFQKLSSVWPMYGKNRQSLAELWIGFFRYYSETFDFDDQVVSIRQHTPLTCFEKLWNNKCISIEDCFNLNHNLGSGLSGKMSYYIRAAFINGRSIFCKNIRQLPEGYLEWGDYFFDKSHFGGGPPPTDRCCRACNRIGHFVKDCPVIQNRKNRRVQPNGGPQLERAAQLLSSPGARPAQNRNCFKCGESGHIARECTSAGSSEGAHSGGGQGGGGRGENGDPKLSTSHTNNRKTNQNQNNRQSYQGQGDGSASRSVRQLGGYGNGSQAVRQSDGYTNSLCKSPPARLFGTPSNSVPQPLMDKSTPDLGMEIACSAMDILLHNDIYSSPQNMFGSHQTTPNRDYSSPRSAQSPRNHNAYSSPSRMQPQPLIYDSPDRDLYRMNSSHRQPSLYTPPSPGSGHLGTPPRNTLIGSEPQRQSGSTSQLFYNRSHPMVNSSPQHPYYQQLQRGGKQDLRELQQHWQGGQQQKQQRDRQYQQQQGGQQHQQEQRQQWSDQQQQQRHEGHQQGLQEQEQLERVYLNEVPLKSSNTKRRAKMRARDKRLLGLNSGQLWGRSAFYNMSANRLAKYHLC